MTTKENAFNSKITSYNISLINWQMLKKVNDDFHLEHSTIRRPYLEWINKIEY